MLSNIFKLSKVLNETTRLTGIKEFNTQIPIKIEVLKEINPITYKIKMGNKETTTKSYIPLEINKKYFALVKEKKHYIEISKLKEYPKILETLEKLPKTSQKILSKDEIIHHLKNAKTKDEFLFFANILIAFEKKIHHLLITDSNNKGIMQFKYEKNRVKFYSVFKFLGELEGFISNSSAIIYTNFENIANLLKNNKDNLNLHLEVKLKENIKPLFEFKNSLIDIKA